MLEAYEYLEKYFNPNAKNISISMIIKIERKI
jgi:hypothetical protein